MTERQLEEIEVKRVTFELERKEAIESANVMVEVHNNTPFHATTYARNMLMAKLMVMDTPTIKYITLYGEEIDLTKDEAILVLKAIVERQDYYWAEYFSRVKALYA